MLERLRLEQRDYWDVITNGGELSHEMALLANTPLRKQG
jgi:hypothetical protein